MPTAPERFSLYPKPSRTERDREYDKQRGTPAARGYDWRWMKFSRRYRKMNPLCVACLSNGVTRQAHHVDHIMPLDKGGKKYDPENLQALCKYCHGQKTRRESC